MRTREEHLQWCKDRALEYWRAYDLQNAVASMLNDLIKHDETKNYPGVMAILGMHYVEMHDRHGIKRWIEGFR